MIQLNSNTMTAGLPQSGGIEKTKTDSAALESFMEAMEKKIKNTPQQLMSSPNVMPADLKMQLDSKSAESEILESPEKFGAGTKALSLPAGPKSFPVLSQQQIEAVLAKHEGSPNHMEGSPIPEVANKLQPKPVMERILDNVNPSERNSITQVMGQLNGEVQNFNKKELLKKGLDGKESKELLKSEKADLNAMRSPQSISGGDFMKTMNQISGKSKESKLDLGMSKGSRPLVELSSPMPVLSSVNPSGFASTPVKQLPKVEMNGEVVKGAGAKDRFSSVALTSIGANIQSLRSQGGGEMKIRLKPEHLGELSLRVKTSGNNVSLKIHASDDRAKRILEDSVGYLKENLKIQNLSLAKVDFGILQSAPQASSSVNAPSLGSFESSMNSFDSLDNNDSHAAYRESEREKSGRGKSNDLWKQETVQPGVLTQPVQSQSVGAGRIDVRV